MIYYLYSEGDDLSVNLTAILMRKLPGQINKDTSNINPSDIRIIVQIKDPKWTMNELVERGGRNDIFITDNHLQDAARIGKFEPSEAKIIYINPHVDFNESIKAIVSCMYECNPELREQEKLNLA